MTENHTKNQNYFDWLPTEVANLIISYLTNRQDLKHLCLSNQKLKELIYAIPLQDAKSFIKKDYLVANPVCQNLRPNLRYGEMVTFFNQLKRLNEKKLKARSTFNYISLASAITFGLSTLAAGITLLCENLLNDKGEEFFIAGVSLIATAVFMAKFLHVFLRECGTISACPPQKQLNMIDKEISELEKEIKTSIQP